MLVLRKKDSCPGVDGIPYSVWKAGGGIAIDALYQLYLSGLQFGSFPAEFNSSLAAFLPKGDIEVTQPGQVKPPASTRPLTLSNTDNKLLASAYSAPLRQIASEVVHHSQAGFLPGRQILDHIISLDSELRIWRG
eukprot:8269132-Pyramimonas_sp.AAC.1